MPSRPASSALPAGSGGGLPPRHGGPSAASVAEAAAAAAAAADGGPTASSSLYEPGNSIDSGTAESGGDEAGGEVVADPGPLGWGGFYWCARTLTIKSGAPPLPSFDGEPSITHVSVSPGDATALVIVGGSQLLLLDLANLDAKEDGEALRPIGGPCESHGPAALAFCGPGASVTAAGVVSMDAAVRKPLLATLGVDGCVRLWNTVTRNCELIKSYAGEPPTLLAMHPGGLHMLLAFPDKLRLCAIHAEDIRPMRSWPIKLCTEARFSRGGALWASTSGTNVQVFSFLTGTLLMTLRGHNSRVTSLHWAYNDATLLSAGTDGALFEWDVREGKRARETYLKGAQFLAVAPSRDGSTVFAVGHAPVLLPASAATLAATGGGKAAALGPTTSVPTLRQINMDTGTVAREWVLPHGMQHASLALLPGTSATQPLLFAGEAMPSHAPFASSHGSAVATAAQQASAIAGPRGPGGLAVLGAASIAAAASASWAQAAIPLPGAVRAFAFPLADAPYSSLSQACAGAIGELHRLSGAVASSPSGGRSPMSSPYASPGGVVASLQGAVPRSRRHLLSIPFDDPAGAVYPAASAGVARMQLSYDGSRLFVAGKDGCVIVFDVKDAENRPVVVDGTVKLPWAEEVLITLPDWDAK